MIAHLVVIRVRTPLVHPPRTAHEGQYVSGAEIDAALCAAADVNEILGILHRHAGADHDEEREQPHFVYLFVVQEPPSGTVPGREARRADLAGGLEAGGAAVLRAPAI